MTRERDLINSSATQLKALYLEIVDENGNRTNLIFPMYDKDKALNALMQFANAPDMNFVSLAKRNA